MSTYVLHFLDHVSKVSFFTADLPIRLSQHSKRRDEQFREDVSIFVLQNGFIHVFDNKG